MNKVPRNKILILAAVLLSAVLIFLVISLVRSPKNSAKLTVEVAPSGSTIKINGKKVRAGQSSQHAGKITVEVSRKGFKTVTETITLGEYDDRYVGIALQSDDSSTSDWYDKHENDRMRAEGISSRVFDDSTENDIDKSPIIKELPYISAGNKYRIDYGTSEGDDPDKPVRIFITAPTAAIRQSALDWIKASGWDVSDYKIVFINRSP